jgi:hypothetical protein
MFSRSVWAWGVEGAIGRENGGNGELRVSVESTKACMIFGVFFARDGLGFFG